MYGSTSRQVGAGHGSGRADEPDVAAPDGARTVGAVSARAPDSEPGPLSRPSAPTTPTRPLPGGPAPVVTWPGPTGSRLSDLYRDFAADPSVVDRFVADYVALLDVRLSAIAGFLAAGDHEQAVVAVLSLESTSAMLGVDAVSASAHRLRRAVEDAAPNAAPSSLRRGRGQRPSAGSTTADAPDLTALLRELADAVADVRLPALPPAG